MLILPTEVALVKKINAEDRLIDFIRLLWPTVEPANVFCEGWAIEAICDHLEAVTSGEIRRLIINVPPGFMKSMTTCVFWPAWEWIKKPSMRYVCASYSSMLTERDNLRMCRLIQSPEYQAMWGSVFTANESMTKVSNSETGFKLATSVSGVGTGERGDRVVIDDGNSIKEVESVKVRESTNQWVREVVPTRLSNPMASAIINIQQRTHEGDVTGTLLADEGGYEHLMIPMRYDGRRYVSGIGWEDPRADEFEDWQAENSDREDRAMPLLPLSSSLLAWPERFPMWVVDRDEKAMGPYATAGQHQQAPSPRGGGILKREWWQQWGPDDPRGFKFPQFDFVCAWLDGAYTEKESNDPSALAVLGTFEHPITALPKVMLVRVWTDRLQLHELVLKVDATCRRYRVSTLLVENKASGISVVQELARLFAQRPYNIVLVDPRGRDKISRAHAVVPMFVDGIVYAPRTEWAIAAQDECAVFPRGSHDDQVDAIVGGLKWLRDAGMVSRKEEHRSSERERLMDQDQRDHLQPLYRT